jgi:hypothetical protein
MFCDSVVQKFEEIVGFAICGLAHLKNLRSCDNGMNPTICGFAICGLLKNVCLPTAGIM